MSKYEGAQPAERDATPESLVPDVRTGIAKYLYNLERGKFTETNWLYKYQWDERAEYAPINEKLELIRAEYRHKADQILAYLEEQGWRRVDPDTIHSIDEFRQKYFPSEYKRTQDLKAIGICPDCEGEGVCHSCMGSGKYHKAVSPDKY